MGIAAYAVAIWCLALFAAGCSKERANPLGPGPHPASWVDPNSPDFHGADVARLGSQMCLDCHTVTATNPASKPAVSISCARSTACHASEQGVDSLGCTTCHGALGGGHSAHFGQGISGCSTCHNLVATASGLSGTLHMDGRVEVNLGSGAVGTFSATAKTCAGSNCHLGTSPVWDAAGNLSCNGCHPKTGLPATHAAHFAALRGANCSTCHAKTAADSTRIADPTKHLNHQVDVDLSSLYGGSYRSATGTCQGTYCHRVASPAWSLTTRLSCNGCHPKSALPAAHPAHFAAMAEDNCATCHAKTAADSTHIADATKHINLQVDVDLSASYGGSYNAAVGTCQGTYCHGGTATTPRWTGSTQVDCDGCHPTSGLPGRHTFHLRNVVGGQCNICHSATVVEGNQLLPNGLHVDHTIDVALLLGMTYSPTTNTCSKGCHPKGSENWFSTDD